jgi:hypothetical protein
MTRADIQARAVAIAAKMIEASGEQEPFYKIETSDNGSKERKVTSGDFTSSEDRRVGVILDSSTHGKHEDTGFDEHMRKIRERMQEIK